MSDYSIARGSRSTWPEDIESTNICLGFCLRGIVCLSLGIYSFFFYLTILACFLHPENTGFFWKFKIIFSIFHFFATILGWHKFFVTPLPIKIVLLQFIHGDTHIYTHTIESPIANYHRNTFLTLIMGSSSGAASCQYY